MISFTEFNKLLRSTLNHLYDPDFLRHSQFSALLNLSGQFDTPVFLQRTLEEAIEELHPGDDVPFNGQPWRTYDILVSRYIHQLNQEEVANQIGVSTRQFVREQAVAIESLAGILWNKFILPKIRSSYRENLQGDPTSTEDFTWLNEQPSDQLVGVHEEFNYVLDLLQPLTERYMVKMRPNLPNLNYKLQVHPVAFRQALISTLSAVIMGSKSGQIEISVKTGPEKRLSINIRGASGTIPAAPSGHGNQYTPGISKSLPPAKETLRPQESEQAAMDEKLHEAEHLVRIMGGQIQVALTNHLVTVRLALPMIQSMKVLVVDDNEDFLSLVERYFSGTRYEVVVTRQPEDLFSLIESYHPQAILLDIMMPEIDGWQIFAKLHRHPLTSHIPVFICSILSNEELAATLGASGYLRKPVTRKSLLAALDYIDL